MLGVLPMTIERQFTIGEIAKMLKISERTVRRWIQRGRLEAIEMPGRGRTATEYRIPESSVTALGFKVKDSE